MSTIIKRNTPIPTMQKRMYTTSSHNETALAIEVYEGENKIAIHNNLLGSFVLNGIPPAPRGVARIEITFNMNSVSYYFKLFSLIHKFKMLVFTGGNFECFCYGAVNRFYEQDHHHEHKGSAVAERNSSNHQ